MTNELIGRALLQMNENSLENDRALLRLGEAITEKVRLMEGRIEELEMQTRILQNSHDELCNVVNNMHKQIDLLLDDLDARSH